MIRQTLLTVRLALTAGLILAVGGATSLEAVWVSGGAPLGLRNDTLRLGVDASYPPLAVAYADGKLEGLEIDLAVEIAARLQVSLKLDNTDVAGGLDALAANRYDGLLAGLSRSPDLADRAVFSRSYFDDGPRLLAGGGAPSNDPGGRRVGVELGSAADDLARHRQRTGAHFSLVHFADPASVLDGLQRGDADLALLDATSARLALARDRDLRAAELPFEPRPLELALRRPNRGLVFAINRALEAMEADGTLERLAHHWLGA
jgi:ABC-type amino acid transport substrate-binding protein